MAGTVLLCLAASGFGASALLILGRLFLGFDEDRMRAGLVLFKASAVISLAELAVISASPGALPAMLIFLLMTSGILLATMGRWKIESVAGVLSPLNVLMLTAQMLRHDPSPTALSSASPWFYLHLSAFLFSFSCFTLAAICSLLYLNQAGRLKRKHLKGAFQRLPPLGVLDTASFRFMGLGFPVLALGVFFGALWSHSQSGAFWVFHSGGITAVVISVLYLLCIHIRMISRWQGVKVNGIVAAVFLLMLLALVAVGHLPLWPR